MVHPYDRLTERYRQLPEPYDAGNFAGTDYGATARRGDDSDEEHDPRISPGEDAYTEVEYAGESEFLVPLVQTENERALGMSDQVTNRALSSRENMEEHRFLLHDEKHLWGYLVVDQPFDTLRGPLLPFGISLVRGGYGVIITKRLFEHYASSADGYTNGVDLDTTIDDFPWQFDIPGGSEFSIIGAGEIQFLVKRADSDDFIVGCRYHAYVADSDLGGPNVQMWIGLGSETNWELETAFDLTWDAITVETDDDQSVSLMTA